MFSRIKAGEDCDELIPIATDLDALFDDAGETILQGLYNEVKVKIEAEPDKVRKDKARKVYNRLRNRGIAFGPKYMTMDRMVRVCYRNYTDGKNDAYHGGPLTYRDVLIDTARDIHDWLYHYAVTVSGWWSGPAFGQYYAPPMEVETIAKYLPGIPTRTYSTLVRVLRPGRPRPQYEWEAIARIIYDCPYFVKVVRMDGRKKALSFHKWCDRFTRIVGIPAFTQRAGNRQVAEEIERLKRMSGKDGGLKFLLTDKRLQ